MTTNGKMSTVQPAAMYNKLTRTTTTTVERCLLFRLTPSWVHYPKETLKKIGALFLLAICSVVQPTVLKHRRELKTKFSTVLSKY